MTRERRIVSRLTVDELAEERASDPPNLRTVREKLESVLGLPTEATDKIWEWQFPTRDLYVAVRRENQHKMVVWISCPLKPEQIPAFARFGTTSHETSHVSNLHRRLQSGPHLVFSWVQPGQPGIEAVAAYLMQGNTQKTPQTAFVPSMRQIFETHQPPAVNLRELYDLLEREHTLNAKDREELYVKGSRQPQTHFQHTVRSILRQWSNPAGARYLTRLSRGRYIRTTRFSELGPTPTPAPEQEQRLKTLAARWARMQGRFRRNLVARYGPRCQISGCDLMDVIQAAHIDAVASSSSTDEADNGLLLRVDLHVLYDAALFGIDPVTLRVHLHPSLKNTEYNALAGATLQGTIQPTTRSRLAPRWERFCQRCVC